MELGVVEWEWGVGEPPTAYDGLEQEQNVFQITKNREPVDAHARAACRPERSRKATSTHRTTDNHPTDMPEPFPEGSIPGRRHQRRVSSASSARSSPPLAPSVADTNSGGAPQTMNERCVKRTRAMPVVHAQEHRPPHHPWQPRGFLAFSTTHDEGQCRRSGASRCARGQWLSRKVWVWDVQLAPPDLQGVAEALARRLEQGSWCATAPACWRVAGVKRPPAVTGELTRQRRCHHMATVRAGLANQGGGEVALTRGLLHVAFGWAWGKNPPRVGGLAGAPPRWWVAAGEELTGARHRRPFLCRASLRVGQQWVVHCQRPWCRWQGGRVPLVPPFNRDAVYDRLTGDGA